MEKFLKPIFGQYWNYAAIAIAALVVWFSWPFIKKLKSQLSATKNTQLHEDSEHTVPSSTIPNYNGFEPNVTINTYQVAIGIYDAFYENDWLGVTEDEQTAIKLALSVPKSLMNEVALKYAQHTTKGRSIYEDFQKFLTSEDFARVASHFA